MQKFLTPTRMSRILADMKPLYLLLHEWRVALTLTPAEAARRCSMSNQQWYELESGATRDPRTSTLMKLTEGTGIPMERLAAASRFPAEAVPA